MELCGAIELGGLTPSGGYVGEAVARAGLNTALIQMIRPRPGNFVYVDTELDVMRRDCEVTTDVSGFAFGVLTSDNKINTAACRDLVDRMEGKQKVFHRAFDSLADPHQSLEKLIDLGFDRVMTSGGATSAAAGIETIKRLIDAARGRIEIMPAGGIRAKNVASLLACGCKSVHLGPFKVVAVDEKWGAHQQLDIEEVKGVLSIVQDRMEK